MSSLAICTLLALSGPAPASAGGAGRSEEVTFETLLREMIDLEALARLPAPAHRTVQFSSYDRRSTSPDAEGWFSNADGFGREPIPGFVEVLRAPDANGVGEYLVADVEGPGAVVRGWSAGMGGTLRVFLDGATAPLFEGPGYDFLADRTRVFRERVGLDLDLGDAFRQQDADYLPVPYAKHLRVTWEGKLDELHFYHLEVRRYAPDVPVRPFELERDLRSPALTEVAERLVHPRCVEPSERQTESIHLEPDVEWEWSSPPADGARAIVELSLRLRAGDLPGAMRGTLLRLAFDGAGRPQVESPVGDLSGTGPGVHPFDSLPMKLAPDGTLTCRFVMPFQRSAKLLLLNTTDEPVQADLTIGTRPWEWDARSLYFRARWRTDSDLDQRFGGFDLPFVVLQGRGRFVGVASLITNPAPVPHPAGSWWGEGDEKVFVDGELAFYGTGSEDYYNYSWSRPDLFDHPYCGQPADTGPGNQGYCTNHRWQVLDSVPFDHGFAFFMELWHHRAQPGLAYSRLAYVYARPGAIDDHRRVQLSELVVIPLPAMEPAASHGAQGASFRHFDDAELVVAGGSVGLERGEPTAARGVLVTWRAEPGDRLSFPFELDKAGERRISLVAAHWPEGGAVKVTLDDEPLAVDDLGGAEFGEVRGAALVLRSRYARRLLSSGFERRELEAGVHHLTFECVEAGRFGFDYVWVR